MNDWLTNTIRCSDGNDDTTECSAAAGEEQEEGGGGAGEGWGQSTVEAKKYEESRWSEANPEEKQQEAEQDWSSGAGSNKNWGSPPQTHGQVWTIIDNFIIYVQSSSFQESSQCSEEEKIWQTHDLLSQSHLHHLDISWSECCGSLVDVHWWGGQKKVCFNDYHTHHYYLYHFSPGLDQSSSWVRFLCSQVSSSLSSVWRYVSGAVKIHNKVVLDNIDIMHNQQWLLPIF